MFLTLTTNTVVGFISIAIVIVGQSECQEQISCGKLKYPFQTTVNGIDKIIPWAAVLVDNKESLLKDKAIMPGILVSPSLVMLSGRFFLNESRKSLHVSDLDSNYTVVLGSQEFSNGESQVQRIPVSFISDHPAFGRGNKWSHTNHSIALAHLAYPVQLSERVQPVCIPTIGDKSRMENALEFNPTFVMGWSENDTSHYNGFQLKALNRTRCKEFWRHKRATGHRAPYCAVISQTNDGDYCPSSNVGSFYLRNGSFFLEGLVWGKYKDTEMCTINTTLLVYTLTNDGSQWIENSEKCGSNRFACFSGGICIERSNICDGKIDCKDSSDEIVSYCTNSDACGMDEFTCRVHGSCVSKTRINDGNKDCPDGEDEPDSTTSPSPLDYKLSPVWIIIFCVFIGGVLIIGYVYFHIKVKRLKKQLRDLTKEEVDEFFKGLTLNSTENTYLDITDKEKECHVSLYVNSSVLANPWNDVLEISEKLLDIREELDRGQFGVVYKGNLKITDPLDLSESTREVAVKAQLPEMGADEFKNLLREIKVTAHVGSHDCIVSIVGACTQNIKKRKVYLVVEYCSNGNLLNFLKRLDKHDFAKFNTSEDRPISFTITKQVKHQGSYGRQQILAGHSETGFPIAYSDFFKWASQIASGMAHLGLKNVIHGDLAARNILLDDHFDAKICDFGLSRELTDNNIYVKTSNQPIPWKWLALESFTSHTFSYASDVWAYGVTLWEIFSLGESPYGDIPCNRSFVLGLQKGSRLPKPDFASPQLYEILLNTWNEDPAKRPGFGCLKLFFSELEKKPIGKE